VYLWGENEDNCLGVGTSVPTDVPQPLKVLSDKGVRRISCGFKHTIATTASGNVYSWGYGRHGVLGNGLEVVKTTPSTIELFDQQSVIISDISNGGMHSAAIGIDGQVYVWGEGRGFKTGHSTCEDYTVPTPLSSLKKRRVLQVSCGSLGTAFLHEGERPMTEYMHLLEAFESIKDTVTKVNDQVKRVENISKLLLVDSQLSNGKVFFSLSLLIC